MKNIDFHFGNLNTHNVVFGFPDFVHFGDRITFINVVKNLNLQSFKIHTHTDASKELCSYFFDESVLTDEPATHFFHASPNVLNEAYKCRYFKIKGDEITRNRKYIYYAFECITNASHKPPYLDELIRILKQKYGEETVVSIGLHIEEEGSRLKNTLKYLHESKVFIGMDNGVSHLCRTTSTPLVLIEHTNDVERTHPQEYCDRFKGKSLESILEYVSTIMDSIDN